MRMLKRLTAMLAAGAMLVGMSAALPEGVIEDFRVNAAELSSAQPLKWKDVTFTTYSCAAIAENGSLYVWGAGEDYNTSTRFSPTEVIVDFNVVDINGNYALSDAGDVYYISFDDNTPEATLVLSNVKKLCRQSAISNDGDLYLFDAQYDGNGNVVNYSATDAVKVGSLTNVVAASNGGNAVAAVTGDGNLYTWGSNAYSMNWGNGHLGYFSDNPEYAEYDQKELYPKRVDVTNVEDASFNGSYGDLFVLKNDGALCLLNYSDTISFNTVFTDIKTFICDSSNNSGDVLFAISSDNSLYAMGTSIYGWGNGENMGWGNDIQEKLTQFGTVKHAESNGDCFAVITEEGDLYTWGSNTYGQIGNGKKAAYDSDGLGDPNTEDVFEAYKVEVIIDPFVQAHLNFIEENPDAFVSAEDVYALSQTTKLMKDYDLSVTDYLSMKKIQDMFAGEIDFDSDNVTLSIQALAADLLCNEQMVAQMNTASQAAIEASNERLLEIIEQNKDVLAPADTTVETLDLLVKTTDKTSDAYKAMRNDFIADFLDDVDFDKFSTVLSATSVAVNLLQEQTDNNRELYTFWQTSVGYDAANDSLQEAFGMLVDAVNAEAENYSGDESEYANRIRLIASEFSGYYQKLVDNSTDKYDAYIEMLGKQEALGTASQIVAHVITETLEAVVSAVFPELLVIGIVFDISMSVWEQYTMVDERALERDMYLNMAVFYDAIVSAMNGDTSGFKANLVANKTLDSAYVYEEGVGFYKRITAMMVSHAQQYYAMLYQDIYKGKWWNSSDMDMLFLSAGLLGDAYTDKVTGITGTIEQAKRLLAGTVDEQEEELLTDYLTLAPWTFNDVKDDVLSEILNIQFSLELFVDDTASMSCHELIVSSTPVARPDFYVYDMACPVNLTIKNGDTIVAEVTEDVLTMHDETTPVSVNLIKEEGDTYASKFVVVPVGYDVEITGYADGTMRFEKAVVENGLLTTISTITDVPVQSGSVYTEVIEDNITVALECDLDGDGTTDQTLSAEVQENTLAMGDLNDDTNIDASDAAMILVAAAAVGAGEESGLSSVQEAAADVDGDGQFNAIDAAYILQYAAAAGAGYTGTLADFLAENM